MRSGASQNLEQPSGGGSKTNTSTGWWQHPLNIVALCSIVLSRLFALLAALLAPWRYRRPPSIDPGNHEKQETSE